MLYKFQYLASQIFVCYSIIIIFDTILLLHN